jgi:REP element-mobilizing transposase RayT
MPYNPAIHHRRSIRLTGYDYSQAGMYYVTICCQDRVCRFGEIKNEEMILNDFGKIAYDEWVKLSERYASVLLDVFQIMPNHVHGIIALENDATTDVGATLAVARNENTVARNENTVARNENTVARNENTVARNENTVARNDNAGAFDNGAAIFDNGAAIFDNRAGASPAPTGIANENTDIPNVRYTIGNIVGAYKSLVANQCLEICKSQNEYLGKLWQRNYWERIIRNEASYQYIANYIINNPIHWQQDTLYYQI